MSMYVSNAAVLIAFIFTFMPLAGISTAVEHDHMQHEMMMKQGESKKDTRMELKMTDQMKVMHKGIMRSHLDTLSKIAAVLAANDMANAAKIAKDNLGWNESEEKMCSVFGKSAGKEFLELGKAMHQKADELADAAKTGNRDKALVAMSELINNCNACHNKFRH